MTGNQFRLVRWLGFLSGAAAIVIWLIFVFWARRFTDAHWASLVPGFADVETQFGPTPSGHVSWIMGLFLGFLTLILGVIWLYFHFVGVFQQPEVQLRLFSNALALAAACGIFVCWTQTPEQPWYRIETMMTDPGSVIVFGQRLLLIWPAVLLKHFVPQLSYLVAFKVTQGLAILVAVYLVGKWAEIFVGEFRFIGQIMLAAYLVPTFAYLNAHDIGIVIIYTLCFLLLYQRKYSLFCLVFCIGIFNHQNILLLIPTALAVMWGRESRSRVIGVTAFLTVIYFAIQFLLNRFMPIPATHIFKIWWNIRMIVEMRRTMVLGFITLAPWYAAAIAVFRPADPFLKRASVLFPMQLGVFFLYGALNEARIFNGFLPILFGILLCFVRDRFLNPRVPVADVSLRIAV